MELIDGIIGQAFSALRKQREAAGAAYYDAITYTQGAFTRVPEALRPKPGRLTPAQQRVYDVKLKQTPYPAMFFFDGAVALINNLFMCYISLCFAGLQEYLAKPV